MKTKDDDNFERIVNSAKGSGKIYKTLPFVLNKVDGVRWIKFAKAD